MNITWCVQIDPTQSLGCMLLVTTKSNLEERTTVAQQESPRYIPNISLKTTNTSHIQKFQCPTIWINNLPMKTMDTYANALHKFITLPPQTNYSQQPTFACPPPAHAYNVLICFTKTTLPPNTAQSTANSNPQKKAQNADTISTTTDIARKQSKLAPP